MRSDKIKDARIEELIHRLVAEYIHREASNQSLITVTKVVVTDFGRSATVYISVLPDKECRPALSFIEHHLSEMREYVRDHSDLRVLPRLSVGLDPELMVQ
ncbi:MAG: hypothetical protein QG665_297 [Patescibacteria group bacterium]|nr:hypothetical protein [Patescibacteria group bacterium]